jgi:hypothetical protein
MFYVGVRMPIENDLTPTRLGEAGKLKIRNETTSTFSKSS